MLPSTSPRAILYLPSPLQESVTGLPGAPAPTSQRLRRASPDGWVRVNGPTHGHPLALDPDMRRTLGRPDSHRHLTVPVCEDPERLGQRNLAAVHAVQINVFAKLAREVLPRASGPRVRQYLERSQGGDPWPLLAGTGLTPLELVHFREYFGRLVDYPSGQSLHRPELLAVAEHLLGGSAQQDPGAAGARAAGQELWTSAARSWSGPLPTTLAPERLCALGKRQRARLELGYQATRDAIATCRAQGPGDAAALAKLAALEARLVELDCYLGLVKTLTAVLRQPSVQAMLAPEPPLAEQAKRSGYRVAQQVISGASMVNGALWSALQPQLRRRLGVDLTRPAASGPPELGDAGDIAERGPSAGAGLGRAEL